jgi:outer membrane lipoprotein-sorting protein
MLMQRFHRITATFTTPRAWLATGLLIITSTTLVGAQELKTPQEIMDFAVSKMATYKTWSADYNQSMSLLGSQMTLKGQVVQKPPHRVWMQLEMPAMGQQGQMTMVMGPDGIMWQVVEMGPRHQIMKMDMNKLSTEAAAKAGMKGNPLDQFDPGKQLETTRSMCDFSPVAAKEIDGQSMYVLDGSWKQGALTNQELATITAMVGKTRMFIGQTDGFVHRLEQYDKSKTNIVVAMEFKNLKFNQDVPDSTFVYQPPAGAQVVDMTPMVGAQINGQEGNPAPAPQNAAPPPAAPTGK